MALENGVAPGDWRSLHCIRVKERGLNVRIIVIILLSMVGKIYAGISVDKSA